MKMTVLEMTQNILSAMNGEEVSSISDTIESIQVAEEIRTTYYENFGQFEVRSRFQLAKLEALVSPTTYPNVLRVADSVDHFEWIKYNIGTVDAPIWKEVQYCSPKEFFEYVSMNTTGNLEVVTTVDSGSPYYIRNDQHPTYWTTYDDEYIIFDSFNSEVEATLQNSKSLIFAEVIPSFTLSDTFVPDLHDKDFPLLLSEAKAASFINYKGVSNAKEEQRSRRQRVRMQNNRSRFNAEDLENRTDFGRS